jgi:hypothetical protein
MRVPTRRSPVTASRTCSTFAVSWSGLMTEVPSGATVKACGTFERA